jgi:hypothetical protein
MLFVHIVHHYLSWHYQAAIKELFHLWRNFAWFTLHLFSIPQLVGSWIAPWKRIEEKRGNTWNLEDLAGYLVIGLLSRLIGFMVRTIIIGIGLLVLTLVLIAGLVAVITWYLLPLIIVALIVIGAVIIMRYA